MSLLKSLVPKTLKRNKKCRWNLLKTSHERTREQIFTVVWEFSINWIIIKIGPVYDFFWPFKADSLSWCKSIPQSDKMILLRCHAQCAETSKCNEIILPLAKPKLPRLFEYFYFRSSHWSSSSSFGDCFM